MQRPTRRITNTPRRLALLLAAATLIPAGFARADASKIFGDIWYQRDVKRQKPGVPFADHLELVRAAGLNDRDLDRAMVAIYCDGKLSEAEQEVYALLGADFTPNGWVPAVPGRHPHGFHLAAVPYTALELLAANPRVVRITSTERHDEPHNDLGTFHTQAANLNDAAGLTGSGIRIAIADSGLDVNHPDVPTPLETWDVTDDDCPGCTLGTNVANLVSNHGTHVTGSAVGNGSLSAGLYAGAAPGASLLFYKIGGDVSSGASTANEIQALNMAVAAGARVFSMSYGGIGFFMDGSGSMEQAIDAAFESGTLCVISAGNEAGAGEHYQQSVAPGATTGSISLLKSTSSGTDALLWVTWRDDDPNATNVALAGVGTAHVFSSTSSRGTKTRQYRITGNAGVYAVTLSNSGSGSSSTPLVHIYMSNATVTLPSLASQSYTVMSPAVADRAIAVGATVQRTEWESCNGDNWVSSETMHATASFSSRGPRLDGVLKPDVAAPGATVHSLLDFNWPLFTGNNAIATSRFIPGVANCFYSSAQGTSMAAPLAAGTLALIVQAYPFETPEQLYDRLVRGADDYAAPNHDRGYGLIRGAESVSFLSGFAWVDFDHDGAEGGGWTTPWNTLAEGLADFDVNGGGTIYIRGGTSSETLTIDQPILLRSVQGSARIGD